MKRTFVAIKIPVSKAFAELFDDIKKSLNNENIKWVETWNIHLTLFFLGDTDESVIKNISQDLAQLANFKSFTLSAGGIGVFKNIHDPKVIWIGLQNSELLNELKSRTDQILANYNFKSDDRTFKAHLTLGRIKFIKDKNNLKQVIEKYQTIPKQDYLIDEVIFYESQLTPKGPIYKPITKVKLALN